MVTVITFYPTIDNYRSKTHLSHSMVMALFQTLLILLTQKANLVKLRAFALKTYHEKNTDLELGNWG